MKQSTELRQKSTLKSRLLSRIPRAWFLIPCALVTTLAMQSWSLIQGIGEEADDGMIVLRCPNPMAVREVMIATAKEFDATNAPALAGQTTLQNARQTVPGGE